MARLLVTWSGMCLLLLRCNGTFYEKLDMTDEAGQQRHETRRTRLGSRDCSLSHGVVVLCFPGNY